MLPLPEIDFRRTPVTLIITALAAAIELASEFDPGKRWYFLSTMRMGLCVLVWSGEYWRPFTTTLLHGDFFHAAFNIYWMVTFGRILEPFFGSWRYLVLLVVMGSAVSMTSFLVNNFDSPLNAVGGIGLSGIGYGLLGLLWIGRRWRPEFYAVCNRETVAMFIIWFFLCILMTRAGTMNVDNVGHAAGLGLGVVYGYAMFAQRRRLLWRILAGTITSAALLSIVSCPFSPLYEKYQALQRMLDSFQLPR